MCKLINVNVYIYKDIYKYVCVPPRAKEPTTCTSNVYTTRCPHFVLPPNYNWNNRPGRARGAWPLQETRDRWEQRSRIITIAVGQLYITFGASGAWPQQIHLRSEHHPHEKLQALVNPQPKNCRMLRPTARLAWRPPDGVEPRRRAVTQEGRHQLRRDQSKYGTGIKYVMMLVVWCVLVCYEYPIINDWTEQVCCVGHVYQSN